MSKEFAKKPCGQILSGNMLAIDPASKSVGWAYYQEGELADSGTIEVPGKLPVQERLHELYRVVYNGLKDIMPDVLVIERIRASNAHINLLWAVGTIIAACPAKVVIECNVSTWKKFCPNDYEKTDENDAIMIGHAAVECTREATGTTKPTTL